ncbi:MAG: hypothetical protein HY554_13095, partial [Elusimicrobia bacterium]|nr:hypothetical protein [Elusimicrobiota bacterium]
MKDRYWFGDWRAGGPLDARAAAELCREAQARRAAFAAYPVDKTLRLLGRVRERWLDPGYGPRKRAERRLPDVTGFSPAMVRRGLSELCWTFDPELLRRKRDTELRGIDGSGPLRWEPVGVTLHVLAGNVFVGAAGSLVEGLITRNVSLLKMSSSETVFLPELLRSLRDLDEDGVVSRSIAAFEYGSSQKDVIAELQRGVDAIAVWGGEAAVRGYRDGLPARTRLIVFGPKLSLALATRRGLAARGVEAAAERLAAEVSIWDQNACTAPQVCFVEGEAQARRLAGALAAALERAAEALPPGRVDVDAAVEIQKLRGVFEIAAGRGEGELWVSRRGLEWTVLLDRDPAIEPSPLQRTLRVVPVRRIDEALAQLEPLRGYIQTVGLWSSPEEAVALGPRLAEAGALRVLELGRMAEGEIDDPHDGAYDLPQFHHLVLDRSPRPGRGRAFEFWPEPRRRALVESRLRTLVDAARRSPFYGRRLRGLRVDGLEDLARVPLLTREEMERNMPPRSQGLSTGPWTGGNVTRSGGSTGAPKFSVYDGRDWDAMIGHAAGVFEALGLERSDRVANFMIAGDLYGSFVSFDHINARLGAACFNFAGSSTPEVFVEMWRGFGLNAVEGMPAQLVPFLRKAKAAEPRLTLEKALYAGSPLSASDDEWLRRALGVRRVASVIGANDGGQIAYQCEAQRGALHHAIDDFNYLEVVDASGRPVPPGETGLLVITSLLKFAYPLIRYAVGDQGRILPGRCACGRSSRVLEYLGRSD